MKEKGDEYMQLGCTKKLRDFIGIDGTAPESTVDSFYCWSASLITVNRRKVIVVMHDDSRCGFILYGVTQKTLKNLEDTLLQGMRQMLECVHLTPQIIEHYLADCRKQILFTSTRNRSVVARLNGYCERVRIYDLLIKPGDLYQKHMLLYMNQYLVRQGEEYLEPYEVFRADLRKHYPGEKILYIPMATLDVALLETPCVRRIQIPLYSTLEQLHRTVQNVFAWQGEHLHCFLSEEGKSLDSMCPDYAFLVEENEWGQMDTSMLEEFVTLEDVFQECKSILYIYDYGDDWRHRITLIGVGTKTAFEPVRCMLATGIAPPEDCGGPSGYQNLRRILQNPGYEGYEETKAWAEDMGWQEVDIDYINQNLKKIFIFH